MKRISAILNLILTLVLLFSFSGNLWADEWEELFPATKPPPLSGHTMVEMDGKIYLFGGSSSAPGSSLSELEDTDEMGSVPPIPLSEVLNDLWQYDPTGKSWTELKPTNPPPKRHGHSAAVSNGRMYVFFGEDASGNVLSDIWSYTPSSNTWKQEVPTGIYPDGRYNHTSVPLPDGRIVIFGGMASGGYPGCPFPWTYNPANNTWVENEYLPMGSLYGHSAVVIGGQMYVYGGMGYEGPNDYIWAYDYVANRWIQVPPGGPMPPSRLFHTAVPLENKMYIFGGQAPGGQQLLNDTWKFDFSKYTLTQGNNMPLGVGQTQGVPLLLLEGSALPSASEEGAASSSYPAILFFGGLSESGPVNRMFVYYPEEAPPAERTLTVVKTGTGSGTVTGSGINCGSNCSESYDQGTAVTLTATPASGSAFGGWLGGGCSGTGNCTVTMNSDNTVTATFNQVQQYSLTVTKSGTGSGTVTGSGISCGSDCSETYSKVQNVKLTAKADANSTFTGWSGDYSGTSSSCQVTVDSSMTVTASFSLKVPDISVAQTSVDFGTAAVKKSIKKILAITNNGAGDLSIILEGLSGTEFSTTASTVKVKAKKTYNLKLTFKPSSAGQKTATLRINSNDPDTPTVDIALSGMGQ